jgi:hypothetical protein
VTLTVDEGLQRQTKLGREILFTQRTQEGNRGLVGVQLRDAAGTALKVTVQLPLDGGREPTLEIIRQQADHIATFAGGISHEFTLPAIARQLPRQPSIVIG